jgi:Tfp pilus assembly protein PilV
VPKAFLVAGNRLVARMVRLSRCEAGVSMIELVLALMIFLVVAAGFSGLLVSSISARKAATERTLGEQTAQDSIESIRRLPYDSVGLVNGNPPGTLAASKTVSVNGVSATVTTQITYVNDPTPSSYATAANYKKVVVTVMRTSDSKQLARDVTYVAPPGRAAFGGINEGTISATVIDYGTNAAVSGVPVALSTGPSAPRGDTTDASGSVDFPALTANPTSGAQAYYDLSVTPSSGYVALSDTVSPQGPAHHQLAPSETWPTVLYVYQPGTINVSLNNTSGTTYAGAATVTVSSSRGSQSFPYNGGMAPVTAINGEPLVPGASTPYTISTSGGFYSTPVTQTITSGTPANTTVTAAATGTVSTTVTWNGAPVSNATVVVSGGPYAVSVSGTTNSSGVASATVPAGSGYTVTAMAANGQTVNTTNKTVTANSTLSVALSLPVGTVTATVSWGGVVQNAATVTLTGGPMAVNLSGVTNASGVYSFANVPAGSGYTVAATKSAQTTTVTSQSVTGGATTSVPIALPTGTLTANVKWGGLNVSGASVTLTGGPNAVNITQLTDASGNYSFTNLPVGATYNVVATKSGQTTPTATNQSVTSGATTNVSLALPVGTIATTVTWNGVAVNGATVVVSGGPMSPSTFTGATNASGLATIANVPVGTSAYTVTATASGQSANVTSKTVTANTTTNVALSLPTGTLTVTVKQGVTLQNGATVNVTGGPMAVSLSLLTNASGIATFNNVPVGSGYTVKTYRCAAVSNPKSGQGAVTIVSGANPVTIVFSTNTCPLP